MQISKENNVIAPSRKIHNPKSHAPAVYIPCWLIQVPHDELSHLAKMLYGRLAQWSNTKGYVSRSAPELSAEMGCHTRVIERGLKELRDVGLIETYQPQKGGVNSFIFLDHEFMYRPLKECLDYYEKYSPVDNLQRSVEPESVDNFVSEGKPYDKNIGTPPTNLSVPHDKNVGLKYKEIKRNKKNKSFCATAQKKSKADWQKENTKMHDFAQNKNNTAQSRKQMDREAEHIAQNEVDKRSPMPEPLREMIKNMRLSLR